MKERWVRSTSVHSWPPHQRTLHDYATRPPPTALLPQGCTATSLKRQLIEISHGRNLSSLDLRNAPGRPAPRRASCHGRELSADNRVVELRVQWLAVSDESDTGDALVLACAR